MSIPAIEMSDAATPPAKLQARCDVVPAIETFSLLGARIDSVDMDQLNASIASRIRRGTKSIIANYNLHGLRLFHSDERVRRFYERAALVHIDGMSLVILGRLMGLPLRREHRTAYIDWAPSLMARAAEERWRVFYLGAERGVAERGAALFRRKYPGLVIDVHHGFFDPASGGQENDAVLRRINLFAPNVLMVGMGQPRQEHWILDNMHRINANVILNAGACINFFTGRLRTPPRWMGRFGVEWIYRLVTEPKRLWHRYLVEPWALAPMIAREFLQSIPRRFRDKGST